MPFIGALVAWLVANKAVVKVVVFATYSAFLVIVSALILGLLTVLKNHVVSLMSASPGSLDMFAVCNSLAPVSEIMVFSVLLLSFRVGLIVFQIAYASAQMAWNGLLALYLAK
jgi:hypothetical protein